MSVRVWLARILGMMILAINIPVVLAEQVEYVEIPLATGVVKLMKPIEIKYAGMFQDGGTLTITLKDKEGQTFPFCLDGRLRVLSIWEVGTKPKPRHIFVGAGYPDSPQARKIPINGQEEKALVKILQDWINENISNDEQKILSDVSKHKDITWTDKLYKARRVLHFLEQLQKDRNHG